MVDKLDNMKKNAMGNGTTQCILCGDEFGLLGASPTFCDDCKSVSTHLTRKNSCYVFIENNTIICLFSVYFVLKIFHQLSWSYVNYFHHFAAVVCNLFTSQSSQNVS